MLEPFSNKVNVVGERAPRHRPAAAPPPLPPPIATLARMQPRWPQACSAALVAGRRAAGICQVLWYKRGAARSPPPTRPPLPPPLPARSRRQWVGQIQLLPWWVRGCPCCLSLGRPGQAGAGAARQQRWQPCGAATAPKHKHEACLHIATRFIPACLPPRPSALRSHPLCAGRPVQRAVAGGPPRAAARETCHGAARAGVRLMGCICCIATPRPCLTPQRSPARRRAWATTCCLRTWRLCLTTATTACPWTAPRWVLGAGAAAGAAAAAAAHTTSPPPRLPSSLSHRCGCGAA